MKKILSFLLLLTANLAAIPIFADTWAVTDSIIKDGYYRLWVYNAPSATNKVTTTTDWYAQLLSDAGAGGYIMNAVEKANFNENDMAGVWHIWRAGDKQGHPTYHLKNLGLQGETYILPHTTVAGDGTYLWGTGVEQDSVYIQTKSWGSNNSSKNSLKGKVNDIFNVQFTANDSLVFITSTTNLSRWRLGDTHRFKTNSHSSATNASFDLKPYDTTGKIEWLKLVEVMTDAKGMNYEIGDNPGQIPAAHTDVYDAMEAVMNDAQILVDNGGDEAAMTAMATKVKAAMAEVSKYIVSLDNGYFILRCHVKYPTTNGSKFLHPLMDYADRELLSSSASIPTGSETATKTKMQAAFDDLFNSSWWLGYEYKVDADATNLPEDYIWHVTKSEDGRHYILKNCALTGVTGDSTYFHSSVIYHGETAPIMDGRDYGDHNQMSGTPKFPYELQHVVSNQFRLLSTMNPYVVNQGVENLCTDNNTGLNTTTIFEFETVPASRITAKFKLNEAITDAKGILHDWEPGINPGNLKASISEPLQTAISTAMTVYGNASATDEECNTANTALTAVLNTTREQLKDTLNAVNPVEEGYYYFRNYSNLTQRQYGDSAVCTVYAGEDGYMHWDAALIKNKTNPSYVWKVISKGDGKYAIQNLGTGKYINTGHKSSGWVEMSDTIATDQFIDANNGAIDFTASSRHFRGNCLDKQNVFTVTNTETPLLPWHNLAHGGGASLGPNYVEQYVNAYTCWYYLDKITDTDLLDSMFKVGEQRARNLNLYNALVNADNALNATITYTYSKLDSLIYQCGYVPDSTGYDYHNNQFNSNNKHWVEGTYKLIDGYKGTYWHSRYSATGGPAPTEDNWLQVDLKSKPQKSFIFHYGLRGNYNALYGNTDGQPVTYGVTDYGHLHRPLGFTVTASNDTVKGPWTEVKVINNLPTDENFRDYYSPIVQADSVFQFYRFTVHDTQSRASYNGHPYWDCGEWQMYPATVDEANSPVAYNAAIKAAADAVKALISTAKTEYAAGKSTQETIDALKTATATLVAANIDTMTLKSRILAAQVLADSAYVYEEEAKAEYGDVSADQKAAFLAAIATAKTALQPAIHPTQESLQAAYDKLNAAYFAFNAQRKTFELNKWYYLQSLEKYNYHGTNFQWRGGHIYYAAGATAQPAIKADSAGMLASKVLWGHYVDFNGSTGLAYPSNLGNVDYTGGKIDNPNNPFAMWRIIQLSDSVYAVQNRATGLYLGRRQDYTNAASGTGATQSVTPMKVAINLVGRNQFEIVNIDSVNGTYYSSLANARAGKYEYGTINLPLHQQGSDFRAVWWGAGTDRGFDTGSAMTFLPVEDDVDMLTFPAKDNSYAIKTYPFGIKSAILGTVEKIEAYRLKNVTANAADSTYTIDLKKVTFTGTDTIAAGEPFILATGTPDPVAAHDSITLWFDLMNHYTMKDMTVNGLHSVLLGDSIQKVGLGIFVDAALKVTDSTRTRIEGQFGYISPQEVVDLGGTADATITGKANGVLNAIHNAIFNKRENNADVYSIDGKLIRRNGNTKGLGKGIYIMGKTKVYVQ